MGIGAGEIGDFAERAGVGGFAGAPEPGVHAGGGAFVRGVSGDEDAARGIGDGEPGEIGVRFLEGLERAAAVGKRRGGIAKAREIGREEEAAVALVNGAVELVAELKGERFERGAELRFERALVSEAGEPGEERGERQRAEADGERGAGAEALTGIENPPPLADGVGWRELGGAALHLGGRTNCGGGSDGSQAEGSRGGARNWTEA